eukprot:gene18691-20578_t
MSDLLMYEKDKAKHKMKIAILGECGVGKTSIVKRFVRKQFCDENKATIGVDRSEILYQTDDEIFSFNIHDMAGSYQFHSLIQSYLASADGVIFVYDITDKETFAMIPVWNALVSTCCPRDIVKLVVGNKKDLSRYCREVHFQNAKTFANFEGMVALEVSAKNDDCIGLIFQCIAQELTLKYQQRVTSAQKTGRRTGFGLRSFVKRLRTLVGSNSEPS